MIKTRWDDSYSQYTESGATEVQHEMTLHFSCCVIWEEEEGINVQPPEEYEAEVAELGGCFRRLLRVAWHR